MPTPSDMLQVLEVAILGLGVLVVVLLGIGIIVASYKAYRKK